MTKNYKTIGNKPLKIDKNGNPLNLRPPPTNKRQAKNRATRDARQAITSVYERLGGDDALLAWAKVHPSEFYGYFAKTMPKELKIDGDVKVKSVIELIQQGRNRIGNNDLIGDDSQVIDTYLIGDDSQVSGDDGQCVQTGEEKRTYFDDPQPADDPPKCEKGGTVPKCVDDPQPPADDYPPQQYNDFFQSPNDKISQEYATYFLPQLEERVKVIQHKIDNATSDKTIEKLTMEKAEIQSVIDERYQNMSEDELIDHLGESEYLREDPSENEPI